MFFKSKFKVGDEYPFSMPSNEGAVTNFLGSDKNYLLINIPYILDEEVKSFTHWKLSAGILSANGAICFVWQFENKNHGRIILDSPFDANLVQDLQHINTSDKKQKLKIYIHIVDGHTGILKGKRIANLPYTLTHDFLLAASDQATNKLDGTNQIKKWLKMDAESLCKSTTIWPLHK
jgi:hypothetical protein